MTETPRMSKYHQAVSGINDDLSKKKILADPFLAMSIIEDHGRELLMLLQCIVAHSDLSQLPEDDLKSLSDLGVIEYDDAHIRHTSVLTGVLSDLREPQKPEAFFAKYHTLTQLIAGHDKIATELIAILLLWQLGHIRKNTLDNAITLYLEQSTLYLLKERS
ncbi:MAG: hypothetical protein ACTSUU_06790 [Candidatus Thorarchaeota archaeon]